jgi:hypothetical protein
MCPKNKTEEDLEILKAYNITEIKIPGYRLNMTFDDTTMENVTIYISNDYVARIKSARNKSSNEEKELKNRIDEFYKNKNKIINKEDFDNIFLDLVLVMVKKKNMTILPNNNKVFKTSMSLKKPNLLRSKRFENKSNGFMRTFFPRVRKPKKPLQFQLSIYENINFNKSNNSVSLDEIYAVINETSVIKNKTTDNPAPISVTTKNLQSLSDDNKNNFSFHFETNTSSTFKNSTIIILSNSTSPIGLNSTISTKYVTSKLTSGTQFKENKELNSTYLSGSNKIFGDIIMNLMKNKTIYFDQVLNQNQFKLTSTTTKKYTTIKNKTNKPASTTKLKTTNIQTSSKQSFTRHQYSENSTKSKQNVLNQSLPNTTSIEFKNATLAKTNKTVDIPITQVKIENAKFTKPMNALENSTNKSNLNLKVQKTTTNLIQTTQQAKTTKKTATTKLITTIKKIIPTTKALATASSVNLTLNKKNMDKKDKNQTLDQNSSSKKLKRSIIKNEASYYDDFNESFNETDYTDWMDSELIYEWEKGSFGKVNDL